MFFLLYFVGNTDIIKQNCMERLKNLPSVWKTKRAEKIQRKNEDEARKATEKARQPIDDIKQETRDETRNFLHAYKIKEAFGLTDDLFESYFASYLVLKDYHEVSTFVKSPEAQIGRRIPLVGMLVSMFDRLDRQTIEAGNELREEAETRAKEYPLDFSTTIQRAANLLSSAYVQTKNAVEDKQMMQQEMNHRISNLVKSILERNSDFLPQNSH